MFNAVFRMSPFLKTAFFYAKIRNYSYFCKVINSDIDHLLLLLSGKTQKSIKILPEAP